MKIKVCGMRDVRQLEKLVGLGVDYAGLIFHAPSPRFVDEHLAGLIRAVPINKIGVFVNAPLAAMLAQAEAFQLHGLQLHGQESPDCCATIRSHGYTVIKCLQPTAGWSEAEWQPYTSNTDYLLFDSKGPLAGGNGVSWNWNFLEKYNGNLPFFISGGIGVEAVHKLLKLQHPMLAGVDVNSKFELQPALKNMEQLSFFVSSIKSEIHG